MRNCVLIAEKITCPFEFHYHRYNHGPPLVAPGSFCSMQTVGKLCYAASLSTCCQQYMCIPELYFAKFKNGVEGEVYLELALLVACGYDVQEVRMMMIKLAKENMLVGYRRSSRSC